MYRELPAEATRAPVPTDEANTICMYRRYMLVLVLVLAFAPNQPDYAVAGE